MDETIAIRTQNKEESGNQCENRKYDKKDFKKRSHGKGSNFERRGPKGNDGSKVRKNDPSWYTPSDAIAKAVANIPFSRYPGVTLPFGGGIADGVTPTGVSYASTTLPGVMRIRYNHTVGGDNTAVSAINMAARAIYTFVRHQNSGHANYESPDLMIYLLSVYEVYAMYCEAVRAYRTALTYSQENRLIPDALLTAMGYNPDATRGDLANFRAQLNVIAAKLSSLCVPGDLPIIQRWAFLASNVWMDSASETGQYYVPVMANYGKFEPITTGGGSIKFLSSGLTAIPPGQRILKINQCLDILLQDEDTNIMSGDILKAYGRDKMLRPVEVPESSVLMPIYNEDFLNALENASVIHTEAASFAITQENGAITQHLEKPALDKDNLIYTGKLVFNSHKENPDYKDVLEWSRFTAVVTPKNGATYEIRCGSELVVGLDVFLREGSSGDAKYSLNTNVLVGSTIADIGEYPTTRDTWNIAAILAMFDWCPMVYSLSVYTSNDKTYVMYDFINADLDRPTLVTPDVMERIHDVALLGEFRNPLLS